MGDVRWMPDELIGGRVEQDAVVDAAEVSGSLPNVTVSTRALPDDLGAEVCRSKDVIQAAADEMVDVRTI